MGAGPATGQETKYAISSGRQRGAVPFYRRYAWEWMLAAIFAAVNILNSSITASYLNFNNLAGATAQFMDKALVALPMAMVIVLGMIDISVASTIALSSVIMAVVYNAGLPMPAAMALCLAVSVACGGLNGLLLVKFRELHPMIITLSTMIIYRGAAQMILQDQSAGKFPAWFMQIAAGAAGPFPYMFIVFVIFFILFAVLLHRTVFGRQLYAIGQNRTVSEYSGIPVKSRIFLVYTLTGLMCGISAIFLTSRMSSTRSNVAQGYELDIIAMVVLGGFSTSGGKGRMAGVLLAVFIVGYLRRGLGLININSQVLMIVIGALLVLAVMIPEVYGKIKNAKREKAV